MTQILAAWTCGFCGAWVHPQDSHTCPAMYTKPAGPTYLDPTITEALELIEKASKLLRGEG